MKNGLFLLMLIWLSLMEKEINNWIEESGGKYRLMRQAVHIILKSISIEESLNEMMVMKGGTLLGVKHGSDRYTKDIDFSTDKEPAIRNLDWPPESPDNQYHLFK